MHWKRARRPSENKVQGTHRNQQKKTECKENNNFFFLVKKVAEQKFTRLKRKKSQLLCTTCLDMCIRSKIPVVEMLSTSQEKCSTLMVRMLDLYASFSDKKIFLPNFQLIFRCLTLRITFICCYSYFDKTKRSWYHNILDWLGCFMINTVSWETHFEMAPRGRNWMFCAFIHVKQPVPSEVSSFVISSSRPNVTFYFLDF